MSEPVSADTIHVCTACDLPQRRVELRLGEIARCRRCGHVLATAKFAARDRGLAMAVSGVILTLAASFLPVLGMEQAGFERRVSTVETAYALAGGGVWLLSVVAIALVVVIPLARFIALSVVLWNLGPNTPVRPWMGHLFRIALGLRPWAMAEVFLVGVVVSLIKLGDLVTVDLGLSFWALIGLLVVSVMEHHVLCETTVWKALEPT
ncbi:MAG: paraquat-inducible protein A [Myxococcota bacterium]